MAAKGLKIQWLGHASLSIETPGGACILVDPWLEGNPKYPGTPVPADLNLILCTHGHSDHTGSVVSIAKQHTPQVVAMVELAMLMAGQGVENAVGINIGGTYRFKDASITMVEARHSSSYEVDGVARYAGDPAGFIVALDDGPTIYLAGDTAIFSDMKLIAEIYRPDIAVLPIGDFYTMGPKQAAYAAGLLLAKTILPIHWGTFPALTGTPAKLREELELRGVPSEVVAWEPGGTYS